jgi:hypothetical protein
MKYFQFFKEVSAYIVLCTLLGLNISSTPHFISVNSLMDFGSFFASGEAIAAGDNPYASESDLVFRVSFWNDSVGGKMPNLNPPVSLLAFQYLAETNPYKAGVIWRIVSVVLYAVSLLVIFSLYHPVNRFKVLWALCLAGFWHTLELGQIYTFLLFCLTLAWYFSEKGYQILAGLFLGVLIAIKPNFIVMLPFLFIGGQYKTGLGALSSIALLSIMPALKWGINVYEQWLAASLITERVLVMPGNSSLLALAAHVDMMRAGLIATAIILTLAVIWFFLKRKTLSTSKTTIWGTGIILSLLASPISWAGYTIFTLPLFFAQKDWKPFMVAAALILAMPFYVILANYEISKFSSAFWGWWYGWALLLLLIDTYQSYKVNAGLSKTLID